MTKKARPQRPRYSSRPFFNDSGRDAPLRCFLIRRLLKAPGAWLVGRAPVAWSLDLAFRSIQRVGSTEALSDFMPSCVKGPPEDMLEAALLMYGPATAASRISRATKARALRGHDVTAQAICRELRAQSGYVAEHGLARRVVERRFRVFHQPPVCGEVSGDDLVVEVEPEDLDGHTGPSGPRARILHDRAPFSGMRYSTPLFPRERAWVVTKAILAVFIFEVRLEARDLARLLLAGLVAACAIDLKPVRSISGMRVICANVWS